MTLFTIHINLHITVVEIELDRIIYRIMRECSNGLQCNVEIELCRNS